MTIQERILELLQEHGMWPAQAAEVVEMVKAEYGAYGMRLGE